MNNHSKINEYSFRHFLPLVIIASLIILFTIARAMIYGFHLNSMIQDFMGSFFIIFGSFKIINLSGFAEAYSMYDLIASRYYVYGFIYPFLELALGVAYLSRHFIMPANWITLFLMIIGSIGVVRELLQKREIACACLGVVFKIPMTYVTLAEDIIMGAMALIMIAGLV